MIILELTYRLKMIRTICLLIALSGCATLDVHTMTPQERFQWQSCLVVYCEDTENSAFKWAGLKLIEIAFITQGVGLNLGRGICETYYSKREPASGYVYAKKSAANICEGKS